MASQNPALQGSGNFAQHWKHKLGRELHIEVALEIALDTTFVFKEGGSNVGMSLTNVESLPGVVAIGASSDRHGEVLRIESAEGQSPMPKQFLLGRQHAMRGKKPKLTIMLPTSKDVPLINLTPRTSGLLLVNGRRSDQLPPISVTAIAGSGAAVVRQCDIARDALVTEGGHFHFEHCRFSTELPGKRTRQAPTGSFPVSLGSSGTASFDRCTLKNGRLVEITALSDDQFAFSDLEVSWRKTSADAPRFGDRQEEPEVRRYFAAPVETFGRNEVHPPIGRVADALSDPRVRSALVSQSSLDRA